MIEVSDNVLKYLESLYGKNSAKNYLEFINAEPSQYIRVNQLKTNSKKLTAALSENYGIKTEEIPSFPNSLRIISGKEYVSKTIEHIIGLYYMQGLSSMIPPIVLNPLPGETVLDLCSAPGSKTTELGEIMNNKGMLIVNEIQLDRIKILVYNIDRMNLMNAGVIHQKGELLSKIYSEYFDKILVDAPCSGLGIIQKKGEVNLWWSLKRAENLGELQLKLLAAAIKMLKVGGEAVYSTCTLTPEENELVINRLLKKYPIEIVDIDIPVQSHKGFTSYNGEDLNPSLSKAKRILPWEADTDGFFIIKLRKIDKTQPPEQIPPKQAPLKLIKYDAKEIIRYLKNIIQNFGIEGNILSEYKYLIKRNDIYFVNNEWEEDNLSLFERIGTRFGVIDKKNEITLHTQAAQVLENHITKNIFEIEDHDDLKKYLEGGTIKKDVDFTGQCAVKYKDHILGTAVVTQAGVKSRFPRSKRTQEIIKEF